MKNIQLILNAILSKEMFHYIEINNQLIITSYSYGVEKYFPADNQNPQIVGSDIRDYLPELAGSEEDLLRVLMVYNASFGLDIINKNGYYIDISVQYCSPQTMLITIQDNTQIIKAQQELLQSNNELTLLHNALQKIFDKQSALICVTNNQSIKFANQKFIEFFGKSSVDELKEDGFEFYSSYDEECENYNEILQLLTNKTGYITLNKTDFVLQVSAIDVSHKLFTLTRMQD